ncbi:SDR family oxidoreductase [Magnetofaba australis]|uniref:Putative short-chain dehydrogenase/reductase SDR n=1 Tax=Magnetofaba australis IT-1 TaxID=1434232 RepID=A0A1Y2K015_9PROT|nr:SDR family oxidoreductase [Magnetofaba australis]OSM00083.1 putative short-chain dehydrogenase/reductase SDR [Magnetofaba australis IT-1]
MNPQGHVALVTGAGKRLGLAIARALAQAGASIAIHYGTSEAGARGLYDEITAQGGRAALLQADLGDPKQAEGLIERARAALGPVRILVNSAAIIETGTLTEADDDQWRRHMAINLESPFRLMRAFARQWSSQHGGDLPSDQPGRIVNILDMRVVRPHAGHSAYNVAKGGLWNLTQTAALELAPQITVNAVGPGPILQAPGESAEAFAQVVAATPRGRAGTPEEIAQAALYLIGQDYITGEIICVDGGERL